MYIIADEGGLKKAKTERNDLETALEDADKLPIVVITATEARLDECVRAIEHYDAAKEPVGSMEDVTAFVLKKWNPVCGFPGCTEHSTVVGVAIGLLSTGDIGVSSYCEAHAQGKGQHLVSEMGFAPTENGMFVNMNAVAQMMSGLGVSEDQMAAMAGIDREVEPKDSASVKSGDIVVGDQMWDDDAGWFTVTKVERARADGSPFPEGGALRKDDRVSFTFAGLDSPLMHEAGYPHLVRVVDLEFDEIAIGDRVLMPDDETWCTVGEKKHDMLLWETGFAKMEPGETKITRLTGERS